MLIFRWIYPEGAIYHGSLLSGSYPHFSGEPFVWDYLTKTIKVLKIPQDSINRRMQNFTKGSNNKKDRGKFFRFP
jgi:hypothetical protein